MGHYDDSYEFEARKQAREQSKERKILSRKVKKEFEKIEIKKLTGFGNNRTMIIKMNEIVQNINNINKILLFKKIKEEEA